jgi:hypothetical protein
VKNTNKGENTNNGEKDKNNISLIKSQSREAQTLRRGNGIVELVKNTNKGEIYLPRMNKYIIETNPYRKEIFTKLDIFFVSFSISSHKLLTTSFE